MSKSTIYCSKCGKGNIIESPIDGFRFRCINCNELNQVQAKKVPDDVSKRLREVYQRSQQQSANNQPQAGRAANFRHKKTLVDKNIDLLEKVESMEKETLEIKNEYLEMTHQLSLKENSPAGIDKEQLQEIKTEILKATESGVKVSMIDELKEMLMNIQTEPPKAVDFSELKSFFQKEIKSEMEKLAQASTALDSLSEIKALVAKGASGEHSDLKELIAKELKSVQHVVNTIAGEVRVLRKEMEEVVKRIDANPSGQIPAHNAVNFESSGPIPDKTTQFLAVDINVEEAGKGEQKPSSSAKKGSKSFKAVSDKLKSLKL